MASAGHFPQSRRGQALWNDRFFLFVVIICQTMDTYIDTYRWKTVHVYLWVLFWSDKTLLIPSQTHVHVWPRLLRTRRTPMQQMSKNSRVDREDGLVFTHEPQTFILTNQACAVMLWGLKKNKWNTRYSLNTANYHHLFGFKKETATEKKTSDKFSLDSVEGFRRLPGLHL